MVVAKCVSGFSFSTYFEVLSFLRLLFSSRCCVEMGCRLLRHSYTLIFVARRNVLVAAATATFVAPVWALGDSLAVISAFLSWP